jgi:hypothetical protein
MKRFYAVIALACVPAALAANNASYPKENVAEFVIEKLDITTLPPAIRPKPEKSKKTFGDYRYVTRQEDDKEGVVEAPPQGSPINIRILEQKSSGIYVCVQGQSKKSDSGQIQVVYLLKLKKATGLLKGGESWKEFDVCPAIGVDPPSADDTFAW